MKLVMIPGVMLRSVQSKCPHFSTQAITGCPAGEDIVSGTIMSTVCEFMLKNGLFKLAKACH
jgi:hypothetical protein